MNAIVHNSRKFTADPMTHLLASWRFGHSPHFVCGMIGYELNQEANSGNFRCIPVVALNQEPWNHARVDRLQNGIWMFHAENPTEGVGLFLNTQDMDYSVSQMRVQKTVIQAGIADLRFLRFIDPLWPTIDQMEAAFWDNPIDGWQDQFGASVELMRRFKGARSLFALTRLREDHPYVN